MLNKKLPLMWWQKIKLPYFFALGWGIFWLINFFLLITPQSRGNDVNRGSFETLAPISQSGSVTLPTGETISWSAGQSITEILNLGDFQHSSQFHKFSLKQIISLSRSNTPYTLKDFGYFKRTNLGQLFDDVEGLGNYPISQLPWLGELLRREGYDISQILHLRGEELLKSYPELGNLSFQKVNLHQYKLTSIPRLINLPLEMFTGWSNLTLKEVPGLTKIPFSVWAAREQQISLDTSQQIISFNKELFNESKMGDNTEYKNLKIANFLPHGLAIVDLVLTTVERPANRSMSGGINVGFAVPCSNNCAHIEVVGNYQFNGKQWMSGKYQVVDGGWGCLKWVNGGVEPTGRHPLGSIAKVVIWNINELADTAEGTLFFRKCNLCGCTPYFIGPSLFEEFRTGDQILVGF